MNNDLKNKIKKGIEILVVVAIIVVGVMSYPWKVKVVNGETKCYNLFDKQMSCR